MPVAVERVREMFEVSIHGKKLIDGHTGKIARFRPKRIAIYPVEFIDEELERVLSFLAETTETDESSRTQSPDD